MKYFIIRQIGNNSRWWSNGRTFIEIYMTYFSYINQKQNKTKKKRNEKKKQKKTKQNKLIKQRCDETYPTEFSNDTGFTIVGT
jgi:hypothetical protein